MISKPVNNQQFPVLGNVPAGINSSTTRWHQSLVKCIQISGRMGGGKRRQDPPGCADFFRLSQMTVILASPTSHCYITCDAEQVFIQDPGEGVGDGDLSGSGVFNLCTLDLWGRIVLCCVSGEEQKLSQDV